MTHQHTSPTTSEMLVIGGFMILLPALALLLPLA